MIALALFAGMLSILSPCVLPLVPVVLAGAAAEHRLAPVALAFGVAIAFAGIGMFVSTVGFALGFDMDMFRTASAVLLILVGAVLAVPRFHPAIAAAAGPIGDLAQRRLGGFSSAGVGGQFGVGLLLGAVWTPCVGPTLGAASVMAIRGESLWTAAATMIAFGIGTAIPLLALAALSREVLLRWRGKLVGAASGMKTALGILLVVAGLMTLSGWDRHVQTFLEGVAPRWITTWTTSL
jgi:cytochrome c-type biogenesis protein